MGKLTIQDIARVLVEKSGLQQREANQFATEMFAIILQRLQEGDQVKVKGLGTFKIISVEARESVSVRTGERVVIEGHDKVSFTPDTVMKELVNKPFSQFETVVLNDGVAFSDLEEVPEEETEPSVESAMPAEPAEPAETPKLIEVPEPAEPAEQEEPENPDHLESPDHLENPDYLESPDHLKNPAEPEAPMKKQPMVEVVVDEKPAEEDYSVLPWKKWLVAAAVVLCLMGISAFWGYHYALQEVAANVEKEAEMLMASNMIASAPIHHQEQVKEMVKDTSVVDTSMVKKTAEPQAKEPEKMQTPKPEVKPTAKPEVKAAQKPAELVDRYAAKDERVRLGAYRIVGTKEIVEVQPGQTFYSICRAHLGPDMQCYVEVYNNLPRNPEVKVGQKIRIPQLQWKKRRNR